jgi:DNA polymerase III delta prime subunit
MRVIIEAESVLSALNSLRKDAHLSPLNPLMQFHSIHEQHFLDGADAAANRVYETLRGIIRNRVNHYRRLRDIPPLKRETHHDNLIKALNRDFSTESDELRAWSVLYYRYIELDLELSVAEFALASNFSSRMLLRHQTLGVKRLTRILVRREERYRAQQRLAVLRGMLPVLGKLYGRDGLLNELYAVFVDAYQGGHRPLLLRGVPGVGKSSIAVALAERVIKETEIKQVVWIDRPEPVADTLLQRIAEQLSHALPTSGSFTDSLVAFLHMRSTLIVLDHAQDLLNASDELAQVIRVLSAARVILCTDRLPAQRPPDMIMRVVPPLDKESAFRVMEDQLSLGGQSADPNMLEHTYNQLGGVPGALRMAMLTSNGDVSKVVSADLFEPIWNGLSADARLAWMLIHLIRPHKDVEFTATLPSGSDPRRVLTELERVGVFERPTFESLMLTPMARAFVNGRITAEQEIVPRAIELAADHLTTNPDVSRIIHFLNCIQLSLSPKLVDLAYAFAPYVERAGEWVAWYRYFELRSYGRTA